MPEATIYVIDDDDAVRDSLRVLLESEGFAVVTFASAADFLLHPRQNHGCLVLDAERISELQLLDRVRDHAMVIATIVMTARSDAAMRRAVDSVGAVLLEKPFAGAQLVNSIVEVLRGHRLH